MSDAITREQLRQLTPTNLDLLELAERFPAPQEWYDEDIDYG
ncbi:hypothetical protein LCGC14_0643500 [marine sediment metagenome]|uniref:Uncharacterized protein n=1 Tax=marine sediment metagenome TaxID=412755 RepID=A0A0F9R3M7_9ZZZZ